MKQLVVLSGKGGTGKTTIAAALAELASREMPLVIVDGDVEASNLDLLLSPTRKEQHDFMAGQVAVVDEELCAGCGTCEIVCRFDAVQPPRTNADTAFRVDAVKCEGCAACMYQCPSEAIRMEPQQAGMWLRSETRFGPLFHAQLFAGQGNSGKLVTLIRQQARVFAEPSNRSLLLVDGPPGIGCPVISCLSGADLALLITEPTVSGVHDLQRALGTARHFGIASLVVVNKADINPSLTAAIENVAEAQGVAVVGRIPFNPAVTQAMVRGLPVTSYGEGELTPILQSIWRKTRQRLFASEAVAV